MTRVRQTDATFTRRVKTTSIVETTLKFVANAADCVGPESELKKAENP
jgi:hypothetical protein